MADGGVFPSWQPAPTGRPRPAFDVTASYRASGVRYFYTARRSGRSVWEEELAAAVERFQRRNLYRSRRFAMSGDGGAVLSRSAAGLPDLTPGATVTVPTPPAIRIGRSHSGRGGPTSQVAWGERNKSQANVGGTWMDPSAPAVQWRPDADPSRRLRTGGGSGSGASFSTMMSNYGEYKGSGGGVLGASSMRYRQMKNFANNPMAFARRSAAIFIASEVARGVRDWSGMSKVSWNMPSDEAQGKITPMPRDPIAAANSVAAGVSFGFVESLGGAVSEIALTAIGTFADLINSAVGNDSTAGRQFTARVIDFTPHLYTWAKANFTTESPMSHYDRVEKSVIPEFNRQKRVAHAKAKGVFIKSMNRAIEANRDALSLMGIGSLDQITSEVYHSDSSKESLQRMQSAAALDVDFWKVRKEVYDKNVYGHNGRQ